MQFSIAIGCINEWRDKLLLRKRQIEEYRAESVHVNELEEINNQLSELNDAIKVLSTHELTWVSNTDPSGITHEHRVSKLNSEHLANIIHYLKTSDESVHGHNKRECERIIDIMTKEANRRGLGSDFLNKAPYIYRSEVPYVEYQEK